GHCHRTTLPHDHRLITANKRPTNAASSCHPMLYGPAQKILHRHGVCADHQLTRLRHRRTESGQAWEPVPRATALYFNRRDRLAGAHHEIDLSIAVPPVENLTVAGYCRVRQVRADSRLDEPSRTLDRDERSE